MAKEREVTLKLNAKLAAADGFKKLEAAAKSATPPVTRLEEVFKRISQDMIKLGTNTTRGLGQVGTAATGAARAVDGLDRSLAKLNDTSNKLSGAGVSGVAGAGRAGKGGTGGLGKAVSVGLIAGFLNEIADVSQDVTNLIRLGRLGAEAGSRTLGIGPAAGQKGPFKEGPDFEKGLFSRALGTAGGGIADFFGELTGQRSLERAGQGIEQRAAEQLERQGKIRERLTQQGQRALDIQKDLIGRLQEEGRLKTDLLTKERERTQEALKQATAGQEKLFGFAESFGGLNPLERRGTLDIARKLRAGVGLSGVEQQFASSNPVLQGPLAELQRQQGLASPQFAQALRLTGQAGLLQAPGQVQALTRQDLQLGQQLAAQTADTQRQVQAVQAAVANTFQVDVRFDANTIAGDIARQILPQLLQAQNATVAQLQQQLQEALGQLRASRRAVTGR